MQDCQNPKITFHNIPRGPHENAVIASTPPGHYLDARGDELQIIAVCCYVSAAAYEAALPGYRITEISVMEVTNKPELHGDFVSIRMAAR